MPAYRSSAEAEIRDYVVAKLRARSPTVRIIHEINVSSHGPNRIDVLAVDRCEIIAVEVKSQKDKLDRLKAQMEAMRQCSHFAYAAIHEKFLVEAETHEKAMHYAKDGKFLMRVLPDEAKRYNTWVFPERRRCINNGWEHDEFAIWRMPPRTIEKALPAGALHLLWRDELYGICSALRVTATRRSTMQDMVDALRWYCNGKELTTHICKALRARDCAEADAPIFHNDAA